MKNKRNLVVISLVVMMMITAVGYAAFSDSLDAIGTATNASFDVQYVYANPADYNADVASVVIGQQNGDVGDDGKYDNLSVAISNIVPGKEYKVKFGIRNNGSVTAYIDANGFELLPATDADEVMAHNYIMQDLGTWAGTPILPGQEIFIDYKFGLKSEVSELEGVAANQYGIKLVGGFNLITAN